jgi:hypothetical protein
MVSDGLTGEQNAWVRGVSHHGWDGQVIPIGCGPTPSSKGRGSWVLADSWDVMPGG